MSEGFEDYDDFRKSSLSNYKLYKKLSAAPKKSLSLELEDQPPVSELNSPETVPRYFLRFNKFCDYRDSSKKMPRGNKRNRNSPEKNKKSPGKGSSSPPQPPEKRLNIDKVNKVDKVSPGSSSPAHPRPA